MWILLLVVIAAWGQGVPSPELCRVEGVVRNAVTGAPLGKAKVRLGPPWGSNPNSILQASTDGEGHFVMQDVKAGVYHLWAEKVGFVRAEYSAAGAGRPGSLLSLEKGKRVSDLEFRLQPHGVIAGRVVDEDGEPLVSAMVQALVLRQGRGTQELEVAGSAVANDLGEYRIYGILPGRYYLAVNHSTAVLRSVIGGFARIERTADTGEYPITYYPGTPVWSGAKAVRVTAGSPLQGMDIQLRKMATFRIRGRVSGVSTREGGGQLEVQPQEDAAVRALVRRIETWKAPDGDFEVSGLLPGTYIVSARHWDPLQAKHLMGREVVVITRRDAEGVTLTLGRGAPVRGRVRTEEGVALGWQSLLVMFHPREAAAGQSYIYASVKKDAEFEIPEAGIDHYSISVSGMPEGFFVKGVRVGEVDVLRDGLRVVGSPVEGLDVVLSSKGAEVSGVAVNTDGKPAARTTVLLHPQFGGAGRRSDLQRTVETGADGKFRFRGVTPGEYRLYAFGADGPDIGDIDALEEYSAEAEHLRLKESDRVERTVSVRSSR
ncbi:MAG: carboxypeptidase-like regulatory domain-containing protein [Bryobacteraceae bacterium]